MHTITKKDFTYLIDADSYHCSAACLLESIKACQSNGRPGYQKVPKDYDENDRDHYSREFDQFFRSAYEIEVAKWLTLNGIEWEYEQIWYEVVGKVCIPDFRLITYPVILEVKGLWLAGSKRKLKNLRNLYPRENILVADWTLRSSIRAETRDCEIVNGKVVCDERG